MLAVFRTMSGEIFVAELHRPSVTFAEMNRVLSTWQIGEDYTAPMIRPPGNEDSPWYGIDRGIRYERTFRRTSFPETTHVGAPLPSQLVARYDEDTSQSMPPEILSRRLQEIEAEWLRLGALLDELRKMEAG